jgi:hypothetical protein
MRLEDFIEIVESTEPCGEPLEQPFFSRRGRAVPNAETSNMMINALSNANILSGDGVFHIRGNYNSRFGRHGVFFSKRSADYEADDSHFVYRCVMSVHQNVTLNARNLPNNIPRITDMASAYTALRIQAEATTLAISGMAITSGFEVTIRGRFDSVVPSLSRGDARTLSNNWYSVLSHQDMISHYPKLYQVKRRGNTFSMFNSDGLVGEMTFRFLPNWETESLPLTEQDMNDARKFSDNEKPYIDWIPSMEDQVVDHKAVKQFQVFRVGECDTPLKGNTLNDKIQNRRAHFNGSTQFLIDGMRYSLEQGTYFFAPENIHSMGVFEYDNWVSELSGHITMTKINSRVGYLSNFSREEEVVTTTVLKSKAIQSATPDVVAPKFTGKANTNRIK